MWQVILSSLFPKRCLGCSLIISSYQNYLCENCLGKLPYTHLLFGCENWMYEKINSIITIEAASSLLFFEKNNLTQKLIHFLKYKNYPELGSWLAELWYLQNKDKISLKNIQSVIPVPVHPKRLKKRNYNQVEQCAKRLASLLGCNYDGYTLTRIKHKESQTSLSRYERMEKMKNTFARTNNNSSHYLIVDDVFTTGSTIISCAEELLKNPESKVSVFTLAIV